MMKLLPPGPTLLLIEAKKEPNYGPSYALAMIHQQTMEAKIEKAREALRIWFFGR